MADTDTKLMERKCGTCQTFHTNELCYHCHLLGRKHKRNITAARQETTTPKCACMSCTTRYLYYAQQTKLKYHLLGSGVADIEGNKKEHSKSSNKDRDTRSVKNNTSSVSNAESRHVKDTRQAKLFASLNRPFSKQIDSLVCNTRKMSLRKEDNLLTRMYPSTSYNRNSFQTGNDTALPKATEKTSQYGNEAPLLKAAEQTSRYRNMGNEAPLPKAAKQTSQDGNKGNEATLFEAPKQTFQYGNKGNEAAKQTSQDGNKENEDALHKAAKKTKVALHTANKTEAASHKVAKKEKRKRKRNAANTFTVLAEKWRLFHVTIANALIPGFTFHQEVAILQEMLLPPPGQYMERELLCSDLDKVMRQVWDRFAVHQFGSMVSGLAFRGSDLDVMVNTMLAGEHSGRIKEETLLTVAKALTHSGCFTNIVPISGAKVPIIKLNHRSTGINCDISFNNFSGVYNTRLIKYYMSLDNRVEPMLLVLKYLAKCYNLKPHRKWGLTNYALVVMTLFYLMQLHVPILPTVFHLQSNSPPLLVEGWNCGYNPRNYIPKLMPNTSSLVDLLEGFFEFYSWFDFSMYVISPFIGKALPRFAFKNKKQLPKEMESYCRTNCLDDKEQPTELKIESSICVQDPFKLDFNVTNNVSADDTCNFRALCMSAALVLTGHGRNSTTGILRELLNMRPDSIEWTVPASNNYAEIHIELGTYMPPVGAGTTVGDVQRAWFELVFNLVVNDIFKRVCNFRIQNASWLNTTEGGEQATFTNTVHLDKVIIICKRVGPVLRLNRSSVMKMLRETIPQPEMSLIEQEELVSGHKMCQRVKAIEVVEFECRFQLERHPTRIILQLFNRGSSKNMFRKWYSFLNDLVHKCYKVVEREGYEKFKTQPSPD